MLLTYLHCDDCQKDFESTDNITKNTTKISKDECKDYSLSLIKKEKNNNFEYIIIVLCKKCSENMSQSFTQKENNYFFKCKNCSLNGIKFNYFLSQEEDNNNPQNYINEINESKAPAISEYQSINYPVSINSQQMFTNQPSYPYPYPDNSDPSGVQNKKDEPKYTNDYFKNEKYQPKHKQYVLKESNFVDEQISSTTLNKNMPMLSKVELNNIGAKTENENQNKKIYVTPDMSLKKYLKEKIKVTFIKPSSSHEFFFNAYDCISNHINKIRETMNLGPNPTYYYNSKPVDINKTFKENNIFNDSFLEIEDEE